MNNDELDQQVLKHDARAGERALDAVYQFLGRFVSYPDDDSRIAHTLWCAHAHLMNHWESTPRLALLSAEPAFNDDRHVASAACEVAAGLARAPLTTTPNCLRTCCTTGRSMTGYDVLIGTFADACCAADRENRRHHLRAAEVARGAAAMTLEGLVWSLRQRRVPALKESDTQRRLSALSGDQFLAVCERLQKLKLEQPWSKQEIDELLIARAHV